VAELQPDQPTPLPTARKHKIIFSIVKGKKGKVVPMLN
jgi:hypothetical protein